MMSKNLIKISSVSITILSLFFGSPVFFRESVSAAGCTLTSASWGVGSTTIGRPTPMNIRGQGCNGYIVVVHAYTMSGGAEITPSGGLTTTFTNDTTATITHSFNPPGYGTSGISQIFFNASANNTLVNSGGILLGVNSEPPPTITVSPPPVITPGPTTQGTPGSSVNYQFDIPNPIKANDFIGLITAISQWIVAIAIPIAVIAIVYAGILWLTAGAYPKNVEKAKQVLKYALIGLAIIIIGRGFITLIESIINLGGESGTPTTSRTATPIPGGGTPLPGSGGGAGSVGSLCQNSQDCQGGPDLHCGSRNICQRASGNLRGEACMVSLNCQAGLSCQGASLENNRLGKCQ